MEDFLINQFIRIARKVNPDVEADVCYRAFKIIQENLQVKI